VSVSFATLGFALVVPLPLLSLWLLVVGVLLVLRGRSEGSEQPWAR
jgi:hypothetical protein